MQQPELRRRRRRDRSASRERLPVVDENDDNDENENIVFVRMRRFISQQQVPFAIYTIAAGFFSLGALVSLNPIVWVVQAIAFAVALFGLFVLVDRVVEEPDVLVQSFSFWACSLQAGLILGCSSLPHCISLSSLH